MEHCYNVMYIMKLVSISATSFGKIKGARCTVCMSKFDHFEKFKFFYKCKNVL